MVAFGIGWIAAAAGFVVGGLVTYLMMKEK